MGPPLALTMLPQARKAQLGLAKLCAPAQRAA